MLTLVVDRTESVLKAAVEMGSLPGRDAHIAHGRGEAEMDKVESMMIIPDMNLNFGKQWLRVYQF